VVFLCENNLYAMSFPTRKAFAIQDIAERASGYGIPGVAVDGMDVLAVQEVVAQAVGRARNGGGPTLVEAKTYRFKGHSKSDKNVYRTKEEIKQWMERCPIKRLEKHLLAEGVEVSVLEGLQQKVEEEIQEAVRFGLESEELTLEEARRLIYAEQDHNLR
ncbi:MAG: thiamine pyrophosphate-dependent enzyme, partial [Candidatus Caldatribacteriaceae bacterium]